MQAPGRIELVEVPEPQLASTPLNSAGIGEIIFQPECTCLCGSDLPYFSMLKEVQRLEVGHSLHEMIGKVVATNGNRFQPGERVLAVPIDQQGFFERFILTEDRA
ncbi:MAG: alcohol dehydrogenase catalytic domain-containing protein, partial [Planctomycetes bacterium]|nr:alcohol dehydrogenase catalytic domain-containing protein [Planctomycetota bacterium]